MRIIHTLDEMTETARGWVAGGSVGFVPTMGYLHEGHTMLIRTAHCHPDTFNPIEEVKPQTLLTIAAHIGRTHVADNILWMGGND